MGKKKQSRQEEGLLKMFSLKFLDESEEESLKFDGPKVRFAVTNDHFAATWYRVSWNELGLKDQPCKGWIRKSPDPWGSPWFVRSLDDAFVQEMTEVVPDYVG